MRRITPFVVAVGLWSCSSKSSPQHVSFAHLSFDVPGGWQHSDTSHRGVATSVWTPDDNDRKESITIIRSELAPVMANADPMQLDRILEGAQHYRDARISRATPVKTQSGLSGSRVEVDYIPPGLAVRYHRVHVALLDGTSVLHVIYTARDSDAALSALDTVLATIREGEG